LRSGAATSGSLCATCGEELKGMPARRLGRCSIGCLSGTELELANALSRWRAETAPEFGLDATELASDRALFAIVSAPPGSYFELDSVAGLHKPGIARFGPALVDLVTDILTAAGQD
jgi:ribonuclease D